MSNTKASLVLYLTSLGFFLLGDSVNTIFLVVTTLQNEVGSYDSTILIYMLLIQVFCAVISSYG